MNARGSTEVIVATIGLSMGVLSKDLFTLIVVMAITTTMITPPLLRWALARIPPSGEEEKRLLREEAEAKDFVPKVQRVLIAVEEGKNGKLASLLAGFFTGTRSMLSTVVELQKAEAKGPPQLAELVKESADAAAVSQDSPEATGAESVISFPLLSSSAEEGTAALLDECAKGYDVLFFGVDVTPSNDRVSISGVMEAFVGLTAIVVAKGRFPGNEPLNILVPTTGADYSRRGAELAVGIAKGCGGTVTALYVAPPPAEGIFLRRSNELANAGRAYVNDIKRLGKREGVEVKAQVRRNRAVGNEIIRQAKQGKFDLLVLGVKMRPGADLFFGGEAAALRESSPCSLLIVNS
ncbi:MAG: universal stress protein [Verrucomicrobiota bacterium]